MSKVETATVQTYQALKKQFPDYPIEVNFAPNISLPEVSKRQIIVCPQRISADNDTRETSKTSVFVTVGCMEHVHFSQVPELLDVMDSMFTFVQRLRLPCGIVKGFTNDPAYDVDILRNDHVFFSAIELHIRWID